MSVLDTPVAAAFRTAARAFCDQIAQRDQLTPSALLARMPRSLASLYAAAAQLPVVEPDTDDIRARVMSQERWWALFRDLGAKFEEKAFYTEMFDPAKLTATEPVTGNLADDLADIFRDLSDGLAVEEEWSANRPNDVMWTWQFDFESHWGRHATSALRALHSLVYDHASAEVSDSPDSPAV